MIAGNRKILFVAIAFCSLLSNFVSAQTGTGVSRQQRVKTKQSHRKSVKKIFKNRNHDRPGDKSKIVSSRTGKKSITKKSNKNSQQTESSAGRTDGLQKAGEFNGDLRDLPKTKPADQEHPRPKEPAFKPIPAPAPTVKPQNK